MVLDIKKKVERDKIFVKMMDLSRSGFFAIHYNFLAGVFSELAVKIDDFYPEIAKIEFIKLLENCKLISPPDPNRTDEDILKIDLKKAVDDDAPYGARDILLLI